MDDGDEGGTCFAPARATTSRPQHKRLEKDYIHSSVPPKRPRVTPDANFLFGDTEDIDDDDLLDLDQEAETPSSHRSRRAQRPAPRTPVRDPSPPIVRYRRVLKHVPVVPYVSLAASDGVRLYLRLRPEQNTISLEDDTPTVVTSAPRPYKRLLSVDFNTLRLEALGLKASFKKMVESSNQDDAEVKIETDEAASRHPDDMYREMGEWESPVFEVGSAKNETPKAKPVSERKIESDSRLWVEKYKPNGYMDLLSEEHVNHCLLHWIKIWDKCVFGKDYLARHKEIKEKYAKLEAKEKEGKRWKPSIVDDEGYDELGRPKQKVVLLHGPAGLGKTTAAHCIAKQAGYNVVEMNASDDRSVDVFRRMLDSTTESRSEMFQDGRPNCLVIDEIDGSPQATIDVLVSLVSGKAKEAGKSKNKKVLRRPIICICNDLYTPALRNLRSVALVLQFHPISVSALVERIGEISLKEKMRLDSGMLYCIVEKSECDVRSCLSTMQFIKQRNGNVTHRLLDQLGNKDKAKGVFGAWEEIFFLPQGRRYYDSTGDPNRADVRFQKVLHTAQTFGDYEKLQTGVFENYLSTKFRDSYFETVLQGLEWNIWFMEIQDRINTLQNYSLFGYLPAFFVANHFLFAGRNRFQLQYPSNTARTDATRHMTTFKSQLAEIPPSVGRFVNITDAIVDTYPSLLRIIQPSTIRAIPSQLWSPRERETLQNIVEIMIAYNLTYTQQRSAEGNYSFVLDPDIEELARFPCEEDSKRKLFPYAIKQMIGREVELEKMRKEEPKGNPTPSTPATQQPSETTSPVDSQEGARIPNWKVASYKVNKNMPIKQVEAKDFFGRAIAPKPITPEQAKLNAQKERSSEIWYRYKEGYSNAVRKKLKVKDFL